MERAITVEISGSAASEFEPLLVIARRRIRIRLLPVVARYFKTSQ